MVDLLLESDALYFELGGQVERITAGAIAFMPGLTHIAAGCVAHRIEGEWRARDVAQRLEELEACLRRLGALTHRIYLTRPMAQLETELQRRRYRPRVELGLLTTGLPQNVHTDVCLRPVRTAGDWQRKLDLHEACPLTPDGYTTPAADWVAMEQRKCENGAMRAYLIERANQVCGAVSAIDMGPLLRLKNLVIRPGFRRTGLGAAAVRALACEANRAGKQAMGCFALEEGLGLRTYLRAGLVVTTYQVEWSLE
jgi:GNAT superfamily N-acetyltransferase